MVDWKSGPGMIDEEEEGEFHCKDNYSDFDPDVALSYIGDKVQNLLGHFQKDFEGGVVSAVNLGPRYGGYGSFLPVRQRSPHSKSPYRVQTLKLDGSSSQKSKELCGPNVFFPIHMGPLSPCPRPIMGLSQGPKVSASDTLVKLKSSANFDRVKTLSEKVGLPIIKSTNPFKVRLEVPQSLNKQHDLGLSLRKQHDLGLIPSTSTDSSYAECSKLQVEYHDPSAANIVQIMTSLPGDVPMVLSPLCDELVNLLEEVEDSAYNGNKYAPKSSSISTGLLKDAVSQGKEMENVCEGKSFMASEERGDECLLSHLEKSSFGRVMKSKKVTQVKKTGEHTDGAKIRAESSDSVTTASFKNASDKSIAKHEQPKFRCTTANMIMRNRSKLSDSDACSASLNGAPKIVEGRRVKRCSEKNDHFVKNDLVKTSSDYKDNMGKHFGVLREKCNIEIVKTKSLHAGNLKDTSIEKHYSGSSTLLANATKPIIVPSNEGTTTSVIEDWVECDQCNKWRKLPYGRTGSSLGDIWTCSMLDWLPGMNMSRCDVSEDETTQAVHTTYPPGTVSLHGYETDDDNNHVGAISASFGHSRQNIESDHIDTKLVKKQTLKQKLIRDSRNIVDLSNINTNLNQHSLKMERTKASVPGHIAKKKLDMKHATKSGTFVSKRKNEQAIIDDAVPAKRMRKESSQDADNMMTTKIKTFGEPNSDIDHKYRLSNTVALKDMTKPRIRCPVVSERKEKAPFHLKQPLYKMQDLPVGQLVHESSKGREVVNLKRKFPNHKDSQHPHKQQKHGKVAFQDKKDGEFHKDKKSRLPRVEGKDKKATICSGDSVLNLKCIDTGLKQAKKVGPEGKVNEEPSMAATSSSNQMDDKRGEHCSNKPVRESLSALEKGLT